MSKHQGPKTLPVDSVRELDQRTMEEAGIPGIILMENAGTGAARVALEMLEENRLSRAIVLAGRGNNGGDGLVVARHLHNHGLEAAAFLTHPPRSWDPGSDAGRNLAWLRATGVPLFHGTEDQARELLEPPCLIIDALLGTGFQGAPRGLCAALIDLVNASGCPVLALDLPSGLDGDSGRTFGNAVRAAKTVTFCVAKPGLFINDGPACAGEVRVAPISVPRDLLQEALLRNGS